MRNKPRRPKKFRFHITRDFIKDTFAPCKVADVSGGKGLLSFLLNQNGFESTVIDPEYQELPDKFRLDAYDKGAIKPSKEDNLSVRHIVDKFKPEMVREFDLIVALHGHGCMLHIIEECAKLNKPFVLLPCCVVDEPMDKPVGINWKDFVHQEAMLKHKRILTTNLDFVGNSFAIYRK